MYGIYMTKNDLTILAKKLANRERITLSGISARYAKNGNFFTRLENGGGCTLATYKKCTQWFSDNWPTDLAWPAGIERPAPQQQPQKKGAA